MARVVTREQALANLADVNRVSEPREIHMEILETASRNVWLAPDPITRAAFEAFDPGPGFVKTGAARSPMDLVGFRRSPGASQDGPAIRDTIAGVPFIHVALPAAPPKRPFGEDGPMELVVLKHQTVGFDTGRTLPILCLPDGSEYVQQTGDAPDRVRMGLPEGWSLREAQLESDLTIEMQDEGPRTWWFPKRVSFQGPVEGLPR